MRLVIPSAAPSRIVRLITAIAPRTCALCAGSAQAPGSAQAAWFIEAANIPTSTPDTDDNGDPTAANKGGEAVAIFDATADRVQDVVIADSLPYYVLALGKHT